jgi:aerotaxis receptor
MIKHPDMPSAVFKEMWQTISFGHVWIGLVKNRRKNGDHYWVSAFIIRVVEANNVIGYELVRIVPLEDEKARAEGAYARVSAGQSSLTMLYRASKVLQSISPVMIPGFIITAFNRISTFRINGAYLTHNFATCHTQKYRL